MSIYKGQEGKTGPAWELVPVCVGWYKERVEGEYGRNTMYKNGKMKPAEMF
jgi:hypothetical protein